MDDFNDALSVVLMQIPIVTLILSSTGLAALAFLLWKVMNPFIAYFCKTSAHLTTFWCVTLATTGGAFLGYYKYGSEGACAGGGGMAIALGLTILAIYWLRKWTKWANNEKEDY